MPPSASGPVFTVSRPTLKGAFWAIAGVGKRLNAVTAPVALPAKMLRRVNLRDVIFDDMTCPSLARSRHGHVEKRSSRCGKRGDALGCSARMLWFGSVLGHGRNCNVIERELFLIVGAKPVRPSASH